MSASARSGCTVRSKLAALAIASALALVACEQILGLDHFGKCDPGGCDAGGEDGSFEASVDAGNDAFSLPDGVSEASSWARWPMPNTALEVGLGANDASLRAFDASVPGYMIDAVTGLTWYLSIGTATSSFDTASSYCKGQGLRLPTRIEIVTLFDSTRKNLPSLPPEFDSALQDAGNPGVLWTSSYVHQNTTQLQFWYAEVSSGKGDITTSIPELAGVLCVK